MLIPRLCSHLEGSPFLLFLMGEFSAPSSSLCSWRWLPSPPGAQYFYDGLDGWLVHANLSLQLDCESPVRGSLNIALLERGFPGSRPGTDISTQGDCALENTPWGRKGEKAELGKGASWAAMQSQRGLSQPCGEPWSGDGSSGLNLQTNCHTQAAVGWGRCLGWGSLLQLSQLLRTTECWRLSARSTHNGWLLSPLVPKGDQSIRCYFIYGLYP